MNPNDAYEWLRKHSTETAYLSSLGELTAWDQRTYLPNKGHRLRSEQLALLARMLHERATDPYVGECLGKVEGTDVVADPTSPAAVNVREWQRAFERLTRIPKSLAESLARATSEGETAWERAREDNDWQSFKPYLETIVSLLKEKASTLGYDKELYDALLEDYETGARTEAIEVLFSSIKKPLIQLIERIGQGKVRSDTRLLHGHFDLSDQESLSKRVAAMLGFDFDAGRLDRSAHPFTVGIGPGDVRITTRYQEGFFLSALLGTIHETGHAIYEQGLPHAHYGTPMGQAVSLGIHESQSRFYENFVGRSKGFWRHLFPVAEAELETLKGVDLDELLLAINAVRPSLIRIEADEVTYNLHIVLRFELELALMRGDLQVDDLPAAWNEKTKRYFGIEPPDMARGVMQDVHWSAGLIGYFPTYTMGNIYAAQLYYAAVDELGDLDAMWQAGEFKTLLDWLRRNIHEKGSTFSPSDLIREATGTPPDPSYLILYCQNKFKELYRL